MDPRHCLSLGAWLLLSGAGCAPAPSARADADARAVTAPPSGAPAALAVPDASASPLLTLNARGAQVYACSLVASPDGGSSGAAAYAWTLDGPDATLADASGARAGTHTKGPTWTHVDGSSVVAAVVAKTPSPDPGAVPWLLLKVSSSRGAGALTGARFVQRLDTTGGVAPRGGCDGEHAGATVRVDYTARYVFWGNRAGE
jgi:hypothetical protein